MVLGLIYDMIFCMIRFRKFKMFNSYCSFASLILRFQRLIVLKFQGTHSKGS